MGFEKFEETGRGRGRGRSDPVISIRKSGSIGINRTAMEAYFEETEGAVLYFDGEENQVGIESLSDADAEGAYTLSRTSGTGSITPGAFLREYDLIPAVTTQYDPQQQQVGDTELVTIDLDEPVGTYGSPDDEGDA